ncbi:MAG TPA: FMN-binding protein [Candidatus Hydrogenedentes bacterium]|nr:FMN-binding protein [Candidatus Hydrogenedentota bacterium]HPG65430.1 FMN-binding protein [Candidatus Hydrogenedentota bacterium]
MIRTLGGMAMISGLILAMAYNATFGMIQRNKEEAIRNAVFAVIPGAQTQARFEVNEQGGLRTAQADSGGTPVFAGYDEAGNLVGVALGATGQGYGDVIRVLYGYSPEKQTITGLKVLESKETPGLGDRITKQPFLDNFLAMDVALNPDHSAPLHPIEFVKHGAKTESWQIDGISGATISSKAIARMLRESTERLLPVIHAHVDELREVP